MNKKSKKIKPFRIFDMSSLHIYFDHETISYGSWMIALKLINRTREIPKPCLEIRDTIFSNMLQLSEY